MKKMIVILPLLAVMSAFSAQQPARVALTEFGFFKDLPRELRTMIIEKAINAPTFEQGLTELSKLRAVNRQMKDLIDNEYSGKQIINAIAAKFPQGDVRSMISYAMLEKWPSSWAWIKEKAAENPKVSDWLMLAIDPILVITHDEDHRALNTSEIAYIKQLLTAGANANMILGGGRTLLIKAVNYNELEVVKLLLDAGADINYISPEGTALDIAMKNNNTALIDLLKSKGAKTKVELGK